MLPIKRAHRFHFHTVLQQYAGNAQFDSNLLRALHNSRPQWTGEYLIPLAAIVGERRTRHWVLESNEKDFYYFQFTPVTMHQVMHRAPSLEALMEHIPVKDSKGATVRAYLNRQLKGEVGYGIFPYKKKPIEVDEGRTHLPRQVMERALARARAVAIETEDDIED
jgi:hypothetical protein